MSILQKIWIPLLIHTNSEENQTSSLNSVWPLSLWNWHHSRSSSSNSLGKFPPSLLESRSSSYVCFPPRTSPSTSISGIVWQKISLMNMKLFSPAKPDDSLAPATSGQDNSRGIFPLSYFSTHLIRWEMPSQEDHLVALLYYEFCSDLDRRIERRTGPEEMPSAGSGKAFPGVFFVLNILRCSIA